MTNKEAVEMLEREKAIMCHGCMHPQMIGWCEEYCKMPEAFDIAIKALKDIEDGKYIELDEELENEPRIPITEDMTRLCDICRDLGYIGALADEHYHDATGSDIADEITNYITELFNAKRGQNYDQID